MRRASSAAFDAYSRVRGCMPDSEINDRVLVAVVPIGRDDGKLSARPLYSRIGDWPLVSGSGADHTAERGLTVIPSDRSA